MLAQATSATLAPGDALGWHISRRAVPQRVLHAGLVPAEEDRVPAGRLVEAGLHAGAVRADGGLEPGGPVHAHRVVAHAGGVDAQVPAERDGTREVVRLGDDDRLVYPEDPDRPGARVVRVEPRVVAHHPLLRHAVADQPGAHGVRLGVAGLPALAGA